MISICKFHFAMSLYPKRTPLFTSWNKLSDFWNCLHRTFFRLSFPSLVTLLLHSYKSPSLGLDFVILVEILDKTTTFTDSQSVIVLFFSSPIVSVCQFGTLSMQPLSNLISALCPYDKNVMAAWQLINTARYELFPALYRVAPIDRIWLYRIWSTCLPFYLSFYFMPVVYCE